MNKVVIYTPAEDFWYNSDLGATLVVWFFCILASVFIVASTLENKRLKNWQFVIIVACCSYVLRTVSIWALAHL